MEARSEEPVEIPGHIDDLMRRAGRVLSDTWGGATRLYLQDALRTEWGRHRVIVCNVDGPIGAPATVVVKQAVEDTGAIFGEWSVLEWLGTVDDAAPLVPALYAGDRDGRFIVLEDLGAGPSLGRVLETRPEWAAAALEESQQLTATINGATRGRGDDLATVRATLPAGPAPPAVVHTRPAIDEALSAWAPVSAAVGAELDDVANALDVPASDLALTFHDQCPVNRIVTAQGMRAVDLEMAGFRHPLVDGAYGALGHLRCSVKRMRRNDGLAFPAAARAEATKAYRAAITPWYPEYEDDGRFARDVAAGSAVWLATILERSWRSVSEDRPQRFFGVAACQRVLATLDGFPSVAGNHHPELARWATDLAVQLRSQWPEFPPLPGVSGLR